MKCDIESYFKIGKTDLSIKMNIVHDNIEYKSEFYVTKHQSICTAIKDELNKLFQQIDKNEWKNDFKLMEHNENEKEDRIKRACTVL